MDVLRTLPLAQGFVRASNFIQKGPAVKEKNSRVEQIRPKSRFQPRKQLTIKHLLFIDFVDKKIK
jgi:hypothetical protein